MILTLHPLFAYSSLPRFSLELCRLDTLETHRKVDTDIAHIYRKCFYVFHMRDAYTCIYKRFISIHFLFISFILFFLLRTVIKVYFAAGHQESRHIRRETCCFYDSVFVKSFCLHHIISIIHIFTCTIKRVIIIV